MWALSQPVLNVCQSSLTSNYNGLTKKGSNKGWENSRKSGREPMRDQTLEILNMFIFLPEFFLYWKFSFLGT